MTKFETVEDLLHEILDHAPRNLTQHTGLYDLVVDSFNLTMKDLQTPLTDVGNGLTVETAINMEVSSYTPYIRDYKRFEDIESLHAISNTMAVVKRKGEDFYILAYLVDYNGDMRIATESTVTEDYDTLLVLALLLEADYRYTTKKVPSINQTAFDRVGFVLGYSVGDGNQKKMEEQNV